MERRNFLKSTGAASLLGAFSPLVAFARGTTPRIVGDAPPPIPLRSIGGGARTLSADLSPYTGSWGDTQLRHLLRRTMFGVPESQFIAAQALGSMNAIVAKLLDTTLPLPPEPGSWVESYLVPVKNNQIANQNENRLDNMRTQELTNWWFDLMVQENLSIRERLTLMWTNHFVTGSTVVGHTGFMYTYLQTCRANALGNFKNFALTISTDPAMLVYLNGNQNYVENGKSFANENYARELMELFTLGINFPNTTVANYTETDIQNSARALTGWSPSTSWPFAGVLNDTRHDTGNKTFLGQTGNWDLQDIL
ncbi:MAG TPA: DUF1800 family protein, partial [Candidatus Kapabacteria bacterium]|nr:DUF1800 family protein [Candidatus Kapabacteria bacterium]